MGKSPQPLLVEASSIASTSGGSEVNKNLTNGFSNPENPYNDGFKKKIKIIEIKNI